VKIDDNHDALYSKNYTSTVIGKSYLSETKPPLLVKKKGRTYWKLILESRSDFGGYSGTVYAFIRKSDGAVFRPSGWKKPETRTKMAIRGYITDEFAQDYFSAHGVIYDMER
jgi:hypothetical protein|tara:strand:+ start:1202 stop:1537 length:336 start_codon:yes stop_codon:yes gene_type:complete